jgi:tRNA A37 threonylcarbamoyladenosine dehydratase
MEELAREELLLGVDAIDKLSKSRVAVFGVGGVGGYVAESLARAGVGAIDIIDGDDVATSNINRQIIALHSTIGKSKVEVLSERIKDVNPKCKVTAIKKFVLEDNIGDIDFSAFDYVADAVDTVAAKLAIICAAKRAQVKVISAMGAGNKLDPTAFEVADIYSTSVCPLAKVMRRELKKRGVESLKVVYSREEPHSTGSRTPGSVSFVPSVMGLIMGGEIIKEIIKD